MVVDQLRQIVNIQMGKPALLVRTLLKEPIQDYILSFVYNSAPYKQFIFTGGTALRKLYGLPRLSEDLDFDVRKPVVLANFAKDLEEYVSQTLSYKAVTTKISRNEQTVLLKFPKLLKEVGFTQSASESEQLIVRCDLSLERLGKYQTEVRPVIIADMAFFVQSYDLQTLFANKIIAFLKRSFFRESTQTTSFKGRDLFDLVWLFEQSVRSSGRFQPNWERVYFGVGIKDKEQILSDILTKVNEIKAKDVVSDLTPFLEPTTVNTFSDNFLSTLTSQVKYILQFA